VLAGLCAEFTMWEAAAVSCLQASLLMCEDTNFNLPLRRLCSLVGTAAGLLLQPVCTSYDSASA